MPRLRRRRRGYRRRASRWSRMVAYRRRAAQRLAGTWMMSSVKAPNLGLTVPANSNISKPLRLCPLGHARSTDVDSWLSLFEADDRFAAMCTMYTQFAIRGITWRVNLCQSSYAGVNGKFIFVARGHRNANRNTEPPKFTTTSGQIMNTPGIIYRTTTDVYHYPSLTYRLAPRTILEKTQWYDAKRTDDGEQLDWHNGNYLNWAPALDVSLLCTGTLTTQQVFPIEVICRVNISFRDPKPDVVGVVPVQDLTIDSRQNLATALNNMVLDVPTVGGGVDSVLADAHDE